MPCPHKFQQELSLAHLDYKPTTLIVGTFNPAWPAANTAQWFYGRTVNANGQRGNNFWAVLPRLYGEESLIDDGPEQWKAFCRRHRIAITDLISCINDADEGDAEHQELLASYSDAAIAESFHAHTTVNIPAALAVHRAITNVYLTQGATATFWRRLWRPVSRYAVANGIRTQTLLTPSGYAFYQHAAHNNQHPDAQILSLEDYIFMRWQQVWHPINH